MKILFHHTNHQKYTIIENTYGKFFLFFLLNRGYLKHYTVSFLSKIALLYLLYSSSKTFELRIVLEKDCVKATTHF